jgi:DNA-binding transcriptional regulator LsrR (DeoR family)
MIEGTFDEGDLQKAAAFYCEGMSADEIADVMSIQASTVQRMIEHAEQANFFEYRPRLMLEGLLPEVAEFVHNDMLTLSLRKVLEESYEVRLPSLHITRSPAVMFRSYSRAAAEDSETHRKYREAEYVALRSCATRAADELCRRLFDGADHTIGVNWGISVKLTIDHMKPLPSQLSEAKLSVLSLFGDLDFVLPQAPAHRLGTRYVNSNRHAQQLAQRLGRNAEAFALSVPGFIPAQFAYERETFLGIREFLGSHASYREIFGELPVEDTTKPRTYNGITDKESDARASRMDTIVTGFGSADTYTDAFHFLKIWLDDKEIQTLSEFCSEGMIAGDIAGHLVPTQSGETNDQVMNFLRKVNRRILAAQPSDFVDVACRQRKSGVGAGVVGVTVGARKAKIVARLLGQSPCPISALFIDTHCALALLYALSPTEFRRYIHGPGSRLARDAKEWSEDTHRMIPL